MTVFGFSVVDCLFFEGGGDCCEVSLDRFAGCDAVFLGDCLVVVF